VRQVSTLHELHGVPGLARPESVIEDPNDSCMANIRERADFAAERGDVLG
jgi:hypothetical protein